jgi:hypothetical protein
VCEGKATIRGLRITVDFVLKRFGYGYSAEEVVKDYLELEREDVLQPRSSLLCLLVEQGLDFLFRAYRELVECVA